MSSMYLLDTDFIISLSFSGESTHTKALELAKNKLTNSHAFYLDLVLQETATVISHKYSQEDAAKVSQALRTSSDSILKLSPIDEAKTWDLFYQQTNKGISYTDCANVVACNSFGLKLLSFDAFYKKFGIL